MHASSAAFCKLMAHTHHKLCSGPADRLMGHAIETVMMAVGSGSTPTSRSCSVKVMFVAWAIFSVIMLSAYTANLTANLTVNQMGVTIRSLSDLAQFSAQFGVPAESSVAAYFKNSSDKLAVSLRPRMVAYPSVDRAVQAVRDGRLIAYINDYSTVQYYTQVKHSITQTGLCQCV